MLSYNRANRAVAILCNHQRAVPKTFDKSMENLQKKIDDKKEAVSCIKLIKTLIVVVKKLVIGNFRKYSLHIQWP